MGKKKHKREREAAEQRAEAAASAPGFDPAPFATMAAAALERVNTPEFRTMMAGAVGAALQGLRRPPEPSHPATAPVGPVPPASPAETAYRTTVETPAFTLPPETAATIDRVAAQAGQALEGVAAIATHAIETAAAAVERWAAEQQQAFKTPREPEPPHDR